MNVKIYYDKFICTKTNNRESVKEQINNLGSSKLYGLVDNLCRCILNHV